MTSLFKYVSRTAVLALGAAALPAAAHIVLQTKTAVAGSSYKAVFLVGHGCEGSPTTAVSVQMPAGFQGARPYPKAGWTISVQREKLAKPYSDHGRQVVDDARVITWRAASKEAALSAAQADEFVLRGKLPQAAGPLWFEVVQSCENGSVNWSEIPTSGTSTTGLKAPAALLEVTAAGQSSPVTPPEMAAEPVQISHAWVRATVPGQKGSGAFMKLTAHMPLRLVGVSSPVAGVAELHEMKLEGDVMKMRALTAGLPLAAGQTVELKPSAYHVMLMDLKQTLSAGSVVPLTLHFKNAKGVESRVEVTAAVSMAAPAAGLSAGQEMHKH